MLRLPVVALVLPACFVETYPVGVDSAEVRDGAIVAKLDRSGADDVLQVEVHLAPRGAEACPVIDSDVQLVLATDTGEAALSVTARGGGRHGVRCAIKCDELVAFQTSCGPVVAELRGAAVAQLASGEAGAVVRLRDATAQLGVGFEREAIAPRAVTLPEGDVVAVDPADAPIYSFTRVPFAWSHDDDIAWVSEWPEQVIGTRDGDFSEFNLVPDEDRAFTVRNTADRGTRDVYFAATADARTCDLASCPGIEHVTATTIRVVDR